MPYLQGAVDSFWPTTGAGWLALVLSVGTAIVGSIGATIGYGKWLAKMNGMGRRVKLVEDEQARAKGADEERREEIRQILEQHRQLLQQIGEAKRDAAQCREEAADHAAAIGVTVDNLRRTIEAMNLDFSNKLTAIQTELRVRRGSP